MSLNSHVEALKTKHKVLSDKVEQLQRSPGVTDTEIAELKKQKLKIKEEISKLEETVS